MELKKPWIILLVLSVAEGAVASSIQIPCEDGWYLFGDKCYKVFDRTKGLMWEPAELSCKVHNGSLVTIQSQELQDYLMKFLLLDAQSNVWIGLNDRQKQNKFVWADGSVNNYTFWDSRQPSYAGNYKIEDCVEMQYEANGTIGMWNDIYCNTNLSYICQRNKSEQSMNHDPRFCTGENDGAWRYQNYCYHTVTEEMLWDDAENYCQTVLNGHLLSILDSKEELFINYVISDFSRKFWIGININDAAQQMWSSAWIVRFSNWEPDHTPNIGNCAYMTEKGLWSSAPCLQKLPFVCKVPQVKLPSLKQAEEGWRCPELSEDWIDLGGDTCYIFETQKRKKWHDANFACLKKGGRLASISSVAETIVIHPHVIGVHERMFIGLHRSLSNKSVFEWADGTLLDYQNWRFREPDNENDGCGEIWTDNMKWNDVSCREVKPYICSAKKVPAFPVGSNESTSTEIPLLVDINCSGDELLDTTLTVLFVIIIVLSVASITIYVYENHFRKNINQRWQIFGVSFSAKYKIESNELTQDELTQVQLTQDQSTKDQ